MENERAIGFKNRIFSYRLDTILGEMTISFFRSPNLSLIHFLAGTSIKRYVRKENNKVSKMKPRAINQANKGSGTGGGPAGAPGLGGLR